MAESIVFWVLAPISLGAAISMVLLRNPVHAALMLVLNFFTIAVFYAVQDAQFLAVIQIVVYAGAIMVLFLFVLMLLGVVRDEPVGGPMRGHKIAGLLLGFALLVALTGGVVTPFLGEGSVCPTGAEPVQTEPGARGEPCVGLAAANEAGNVQGVGMLMFTDYVWPFEVTSVLLVIAALGAMVLGRRSEPAEALVDRPERVPAMREPAAPDDAVEHLGARAVDDEGAGR